MTNKIYELNDDAFISLVKSSLNISEVLFKLGYSVKGNSWGFSQVKKRMDELHLDGCSFRSREAFKKQLKEKSVSSNKLFTEHSKHSRIVIRRRVIKENLLEYKCAICGISEWNGKTLSLELDHINGVNDDNRLENLRFLCPNCHSQTTTYGSRNQQLNSSAKDIEVADKLRDLIIESYQKLRTYKKVSQTYNIRLDVVTKVLNEAGFGKNNQKYVIQYDENYNELHRFGSMAEATRFIMENGFVNTKRYKTARQTFRRNLDKLWNGCYFNVLDASGIIHNPFVESTLIDSEAETQKQSDGGQV